MGLFYKHNHNNMSDKIKFWKTAKPFFTNKGINHDRIC